MLPGAEEERVCAPGAADALFDWRSPGAALRMFCKATGFNGTTQVADSAPSRVLERTVRVRFDASMDASLPWKFEPVQREVRVKLGEEKLVFYRATNLSQRPIVGTATYNVLPDIAGQWFNEVESSAPSSS